MIKEAIKTKERVEKKKIQFFNKLETLNLSKEVIEEIKELADSMETSNQLGEKELAREYKAEIKKTIIRNI